MINNIEKAKHWLQVVGRDFMEPMGYLPLGLLAGAVFMAIVLMVNVIRRKTGRHFPDKLLVKTLLVIYGTVLLQQAFFSREPGSRDGIDLRLFATWKSAVPGRYFVENILMFVPLGILLPLGFKNMGNFHRCLLAGFGSSVVLECLQLWTKRGYCQLDDVLTNTIGTAAGFLLCRLYCEVRCACKKG